MIAEQQPNQPLRGALPQAGDHPGAVRPPVDIIAKIDFQSAFVGNQPAVAVDRPENAVKKVGSPVNVSDDIDHRTLVDARIADFLAIRRRLLLSDLPDPAKQSHTRFLAEANKQQPAAWQLRAAVAIV